MNFSVASRVSRASSYSAVVFATSSCPLSDWMDVDFDHAGIGCDAQRVQAHVGRRLVAFNAHFELQRLGGSFDCGDQCQIIFGELDRRHVDVQRAVARLDRQRGAHNFGRGRRRLRLDERARRRHDVLGRVPAAARTDRAANLRRQGSLYSGRLPSGSR
jgi:hypothetical protein